MATTGIVTIYSLSKSLVELRDSSIKQIKLIKFYQFSRNRATPRIENPNVARASLKGCVPKIKIKNDKRTLTIWRMILDLNYYLGQKKNSCV